MYFRDTLITSLSYRQKFWSETLPFHLYGLQVYPNYLWYSSILLIFHSNWSAVSSTDQHTGPLALYSASLSVSGTMIFAGSGSFASFHQEILRIGPKINAYKVWLMLGASWSSSLERRLSHQMVELINCAFGGRQWFPKWNKNIKKKLWELSLRSRNYVFDFCWPSIFFKNKMTAQHLQILF